MSILVTLDRPLFLTRLTAVFDNYTEAEFYAGDDEIDQLICRLANVSLVLSRPRVLDDGEIFYEADIIDPVSKLTITLDVESFDGFTQFIYELRKRKQATIEVQDLREDPHW